MSDETNNSVRLHSWQLVLWSLEEVLSTGPFLRVQLTEKWPTSSTVKCTSTGGILSVQDQAAGFFLNRHQNPWKYQNQQCIRSVLSTFWIPCSVCGTSHDRAPLLSKNIYVFRRNQWTWGWEPQAGSQNVVRHTNTLLVLNISWICWQDKYRTPDLLILWNSKYRVSVLGTASIVLVACGYTQKSRNSICASYIHFNASLKCLSFITLH